MLALAARVGLIRMRECVFKLLCGMGINKLCPILRSHVFVSRQTRWALPGSLGSGADRPRVRQGRRLAAMAATSGEEPANEHAEGAPVVFARSLLR